MRNSFQKILLTLGLAVTVNTTMFAVPADPRPRVWTQPDGTQLTVRLVGDEYLHYYITLDGKPMKATADGWLKEMSKDELQSRTDEGIQLRRAAMNAPRRVFPSKGKQKVLVVLVQFADNEFTIPNAHDTYNRMMNEEGFSDYGATGSCRDYFIASSNGQFNPEFDVYGPLKLDQDEAYYGAESYRGHDSEPQKMAVEALTQLDDSVDFTQYDCDNDGVIDNVYVFYAGRGQATGGASTTIWPHSADVTSFGENHYFDGKLLNHYATSNELDEDSVLSGIGTFCHEFSHVLGLPDFYSTSYTGAFTAGSWSVMDYGPYNNGGHTPPLYSAYERYAMNWLKPTLLDTAAVSAHLTPIADNDAYIIHTDRTNEYFMLEDRQQTGWDKYLPGHGMLVWHIDYSPSAWEQNTVNNNGNHQRVDIVEADGIKSDETRAGDAFPGTANVTTIVDDSTVNIIPWSGIAMNKPITDIREIDGDIFFEYKGGNPPIQPASGLTATNVKPQEFTLSWTPSSDAERYLVTVAPVIDSGDGTPLDGYNKKDVGTATSTVISGLNYDTEYHAYVQTATRYYTSHTGNGIDVTTAPATFDLLQPQAGAATSVSPTGFTANWNALKDATGYQVEVYTKSYGQSDAKSADFTGQAIPAGWTSNVDKFYNTTAYSGANIPSLHMSADGDWLQSPVVSSDLRAISFWHRSTVKTTTNSILIELMDADGNWHKLDSVKVERVSGGTTIAYGEGTTVSLAQYHARALRLSFQKTGNGDLALDDITLSFGGDITDKTVQTLNADTKSTSIVVSGLTAGQPYFYHVRAINAAGVYSQWSNEVEVNDTPTGISAITLNGTSHNDGAQQYFDLQGRKVVAPHQGIVIRKDGTKFIAK